MSFEHPVRVPLSDAASRWLCAWNGVNPNVIPDALMSASNPHMAGWLTERAADIDDLIPKLKEG